ncbi:MAG TPA: NrfD/PsrC family molybdoenzyme membrane anchor subunit, partial [Geobacteraceae bacterium]
VKRLKEIARFSLVFSFALLPAATLPLLLHLQQPGRALEIMLTPHFSSAIAAFGVVFTTYALIVGSEIWFVYRGYFVEMANALREKTERTFAESFRFRLYTLLTLGAWDIGHGALEKDEKAVKVLAGVGIPVACFLHGYAGFIFGSVKANALWMTPLMPVIFICSAVVSGVALCILTYIVTMELRRVIAAARRRQDPDLPSTEELKSVEMQVVSMTVKYLIMFMILAITLELLDLIFRGYTAVKSWDILRSIIYGKDFVNIFVLQYGLGNLVPFILLILPRPTVKRVVAGTLLVLLGVFMMRWNVVIGGQAFSASFAGYMEYRLPIWPSSMELYKEGFFGALTVGMVPFIIFWILSRFLPVFMPKEQQ